MLAKRRQMVDTKQVQTHFKGLKREVAQQRRRENHWRTSVQEVGWVDAGSLAGLTDRVRVWVHIDLLERGGMKTQTSVLTLCLAAVKNRGRLIKDVHELHSQLHSILSIWPEVAVFSICCLCVHVCSWVTGQSHIHRGLWLQTNSSVVLISYERAVATRLCLWKQRAAGRLLGGETWPQHETRGCQQVALLSASFNVLWIHRDGNARWTQRSEQRRKK